MNAEIEHAPPASSRSTIALHWDPTPDAWRCYRARYGSEERWFGLHFDALLWLQAKIQLDLEPCADLPACEDCGEVGPCAPSCHQVTDCEHAPDEQTMKGGPK